MGYNLSSDFECHCVGWIEKECIQTLESWQGLCRLINNHRLYFHPQVSALWTSFPLNAGHRLYGSAPLFEIQSIRQDHARLFLKYVTTGLPTNNTWVHWVKVHVCACFYSVSVCVCLWVGVCVCVCVCMRVCASNEEGVRTVCKTQEKCKHYLCFTSRNLCFSQLPLITLGSKRNSHSAGCWLCLLGFSPNRKA